MGSEKNNSRLGLIFTGGEGPSPEQCARIVEEARGVVRGVSCAALGAASRAEPLVVAADSGLLLAESAGVKSDWIVGDMDSLGAEAGRLAAYPPERVLRYAEDKDFTDTELAFSLLREQGCAKIWILGGGGGRLDQLLGLRSLFERDDPPERWFTAEDDICCIEGASAASTPGASLPAGADPAAFVPSERAVERSARNAPLFPVSVLPLGTGPWEAESSGLKWSLAGLPWRRDFIAISNVAPEGHFCIKAVRGRFLVMVPLEY
jgi:thiamine pyrophosphokinase